jgi:hypothetical protein
LKTLQLIHEFDAKQYDLVRQNFLDLRKFGKYHPVMTSVTQIGQKGNTYTAFSIEEKTKLFGFIPMRPKYKALVSEQENGGIRYDSQVKKNVRLQINFSFRIDGNTCFVTEDISVWANNFVAGIFISILKKMHLKTMEYMKSGKFPDNKNYNFD